MPRQVILSMDNIYPFGQCQQIDSHNTKISVRRILSFNQYQKQPLLARANFFRRLNQNCIIKLQSVLEENTCVCLLYEYIPIKIKTWISNINEKFIESFCKQLIQLGEYFAKCYIVTELQLENVGMDQNYKAKYFLDLNFQINESIDKQYLRNNYQEQIINMFRPFIQQKQTFSSLNRGLRGQDSKESQISNLDFEQNQTTLARYKPVREDRTDLSAITTVKLNQRALMLQKQRKNESISVSSNYELMFPAYNQNEKNRKQSTLSSVSNIKIGRLGKRIDDIKSRLRNMYSPQPVYIRHEQKSIQKSNNMVAFNYDSTKRIIKSSNSAKVDQNEFCKTILKNMQEEQSIFQKFEKNLSKQMIKGIPLKKNESLKQKQYEQMKQSDDGYFKDFFLVLEDKPVKQIGYEEKSQPPKQMNSNQASLTNYSHKQLKEKPSASNNLQELENRVKNAINKSKNLISKFKPSQNH